MRRKTDEKKIKLCHVLPSTILSFFGFFFKKDEKNTCKNKPADFLQL